MPAEVVAQIAPLRQRLAPARQSSQRIGLVPTMGALHAGHRRLIELAHQQCRLVVVSIFVNPTQFDRSEDLAKYPRMLDQDVRLCGEAGADVVFAPSVEEIYPHPPDCTIEVGRVAQHLCGHFRPGHFRGVATVVMKLLQIAQPDAAYFGEKDAQQLAVIRRMVADLNVPVEIVPVPTVREPDGLAMSSRNQRLSADERQQALVLYRSLQVAQQQIASGRRDVAGIRQAATAVIDAAPGVRLEYLDIVDGDEMQPVEHVDGPVLAAGAVWVGATRLIDNLLCIPSTGRP